MTLIGRVLAGRYEILEEVGNGGMAVVYKAKCQLLNRFVAVKVLRPDLQNDEEFVRRFNVEAQAAASLAHPNIVSVYDVGYEQGLHYIVMEFIEGKTLKEYIEEKHILHWREAVGFAIQVAKGLEQAHKNSIIHRDIKPHNIIMAEDGTLKVTDFGIARANVQSTVTCEDSAIGSVHYIAPEQARGGFTDERSDLYSLAIVLYEMLTGRVPFDSERPVTVAIMHLQDKPVSPREYNISIPLALERIVLKAMSKEMSGRYRNVTEFITELQGVLNGSSNDYLSVPDKDMLLEDDDMGETKKLPKIDRKTTVVSSGANNVSEKKNNQTMKTADESSRNGNTQVKQHVERGSDNGNSTVKIPVVRDETVILSNENENETGNADLKKNKKTAYTVDKRKARRVVAMAVFSAILLVVLVFGFFGYKLGLFDACAKNGSVPEVPNVVGMLYEEAVEQYENVDNENAVHKLDFVIKEKIESDEPENTILEQDPSGGTKVDASKSVNEIGLTVSAGKDSITLDDYRMWDKDEVKTELKNLGLHPEFVEEFSSDVPQGMIIKHNPVRGTAMKKGAKVVLSVSLGADEKAQGIEVDDYVGETDIENVENAVERQGFRAVFKKEYNETVEAGKVFKQVPSAGALLEEGEKITLYVSLGSDPNKEENDEGASNSETSESVEATEASENDSGHQNSQNADAAQNEENGGEKRKRVKWLTVYGPREKESALVEVKVNGNVIFSRTMQKNANTLLKVESSLSKVDVEILHDGVTQEKSTVELY